VRVSSIVASIVASVVILSQTRTVEAAALFFSATGGGITCSQTAPCQITEAISQVGAPVELSCADGTNNGSVTITKSLTVDCAGTTGSLNKIIVSSNAVVKLRNFTKYQVEGIDLQGGVVILENVHITGATINAILAEPTIASSLIVKNSTIDTGGSGILLKPSAGGSLTAMFDHIVITNNGGGGIKLDTTNGPVTLDITDSVVSNNAGNGLNVVAALNQGVVSMKNSVIARNGTAGVQANGANAGVLVQTTLFDQNATGATSVVGGGNIFTYGNNSIVGSSGSGFTGTAPLQ
jgi:hypothetical protein